MFAGALNPKNNKDLVASFNISILETETYKINEVRRNKYKREISIE